MSEWNGFMDTNTETHQEIARDPMRWAHTAMDFLNAGDVLNAKISLQACLDSVPAAQPQRREDIMNFMQTKLNNEKDPSGFVRLGSDQQPPTTDDRVKEQGSHAAEWTTEPVRKSNGEIWEGLAYINLPDGRRLGSVNAEQAKAICKVHKAALAAERENFKESFRVMQEWRDKADALGQQLLQAKSGEKHYRELFNEIRQAVRPLTPTDASKKEIIDCVKSLVASLLQAQASIAETLKNSESLHSLSVALKTTPADIIKPLLSIDLSALTTQLDQAYAKGKNEGWNEGRKQERKCAEVVRKPMELKIKELQNEIDRLN